MSTREANSHEAGRSRCESPAQGAERRRLDEARAGTPWKRWGPYLAERAWATVREDYSSSGDAWSSFTHDDARQRAYRWNEDGLLGICDDEQRLCLALSLWNERDPIIKERLFGLSNPEGNHGEDVKELYFYEDAIPSSAFLRAGYLYPQQPYPYEDLVAENARRDGRAQEYELLDTGIFDDDRFFDVEVVYAKDDPERILMRIRVTNQGPDAAPLHLTPTVWFRNTWSWDALAAEVRPMLRLVHDEVVADHATLGRYRLAARADGAQGRWLFTENETDRPLAGSSGEAGDLRHSKSAFHRLLVDGDPAAVNPAEIGTKAAFDARWVVAPGKTVELLLAMVAEDGTSPFDLMDGAPALVARRQVEADEFYAALAWPTMTADERHVQRQSLAGIPLVAPVLRV
ncbi:MAG: hypothetical protein WKF78_11330 [Candidatus Limnocylindrales bacterium]